MIFLSKSRKKKITTIINKYKTEKRNSRKKCQFSIHLTQFRVFLFITTVCKIKDEDEGRKKKKIHYFYYKNTTRDPI